ncbi:MAG: transposase, partial [Gammaproteobacteria bacterium]|nr:transposase [Gammaproteobacteria bacterium]
TTCGGCGHVNLLMPHRLEKNDDWGVEVSQWHLVGPKLVALIVCLSKRMRLSRRRIREFLRDWLRLDLCIGTINKCIHEAGRAASPLTDELLEEVRESLILFVDETSWKEWGKKQWLWVFTSLKVTFYIIGFRSRKVLDYVLGQTFKGLLMSDGYRAYRKFLNRLRCWAHLLRKTKGLKQSLSDDPRTFGTEAHAVLT